MLRISPLCLQVKATHCSKLLEHYSHYSKIFPIPGSRVGIVVGGSPNRALFKSTSAPTRVSTQNPFGSRFLKCFYHFTIKVCMTSVFLKLKRTSRSITMVSIFRACHAASANRSPIDKQLAMWNIFSRYPGCCLHNKSNRAVKLYDLRRWFDRLLVVCFYLCPISRICHLHVSSTIYRFVTLVNPETTVARF